MLSDHQAVELLLQSARGRELVRASALNDGALDSDDLLSLIRNQPDRIAELVAAPSIRQALIESGVLHRAELDDVRAAALLTDPRVVDVVLDQVGDWDAWFTDPRVRSRLARHLSSPAEQYGNLRGLLADLDEAGPELRRAVFDSLSPAGDIVAYRVGEATFLLPTSDLGIAKNIFGDGAFERSQLQRYFDLKPPGSQRGYFLDVGANFGSHGILAALSGAYAGVLMFEPDPRLVSILTANVALNSLDKMATIFPIACGRTQQRVTLFCNRVNWGDNRLTPTTEEGWFPVAVEVRPISDVLREIEIDPQDVETLWIDVQGAESDVLAGAADVLAAGCDVVVELWPHLLANQQRLEPFLDQLRELSPEWVDLRDGRTIDANELGTLAASLLTQGASGFTELARITRGTS